MKRYGLAAVLFCTAAFGRADRDSPITEFPLHAPFGSTPLSVTRGPDGNLWFTENRTGQIGRITPAGQITEFSTPSGASALQDITPGPDGNLWFTEEFLCCPGGHHNSSVSQIGRITPGGVVTEFPAPGHPLSIVAGPDGNLWFTEYESGRIGRITLAGAVTEFPLSGGADAGPVDITAGPDGNLWFTELSGKVGRISTTGVVTEFALPRATESAFHITAGPDGHLWFTEGILAEGVFRIARVSTSGQFFELTSLHLDGAGDITAGPDGNLWFTVPGFSRSGNGFGRLTPEGGVSLFELPTPNSGPSSIVTGPDGNLWITEATGDRIARVSPLQPDCATGASTLCLSGGRFRVEVSWRSSNLGASGSGQALPLTTDTGAFWFFQPSNIELVVKVLDGRTVNGKFWVFYGALSNVEYTITVTDTVTGVFKTYFNPEGTLASVADTEAF